MSLHRQVGRSANGAIERDATGQDATERVVSEGSWASCERVSTGGASAPHPATREQNSVSLAGGSRVGKRGVTRCL